MHYTYFILCHTFIDYKCRLHFILKLSHIISILKVLQRFHTIGFSRSVVIYLLPAFHYSWNLFLWSYVNFSSHLVSGLQKSISVLMYGIFLTRALTSQRWNAHEVSVRRFYRFLFKWKQLHLLYVSYFDK